MAYGGVVPRLTMLMKRSERESASGLIAQVRNGSNGHWNYKRDQRSIHGSRAFRQAYAWAEWRTAGYQALTTSV